MNPIFLPTLEYLSNREIPTLGRRSHFKIKKADNQYLIQNSKGSLWVVDQHIDDVHRRFWEIPKRFREKTSYYNNPNWKECKDDRACPYVAAIIREHYNSDFLNKDQSDQSELLIYTSEISSETDNLHLESTITNTNSILPPLNATPRLKKSIAGIKTILRNNGFRDIVDFSEEGGKTIYYQMISLEDKIHRLIHAYKTKAELPENVQYLVQKYGLLQLIFHLIQLWGGVMARGFYVRNGGFDKNFDQDTYKKIVKICTTSRDPEELINLDLRIKQLGISFASKHFAFWTDRILPVYDRIMAKRVMEKKYAYWKDYPKYIEKMNEISKKRGVSVKHLERLIFNENV